MYVTNYENFDWKLYININSDLKETNICTKESAWKHWIDYGSLEERALSVFNNTNVHNARFGNLFFVNMVLHFISLKYNLKCTYKYFNKFQKLGIFLYSGKYEYTDSITITDDNFLNIIKSSEYNKTNIVINNNSWFQKPEFVTFLKLYFTIPHNKLNIINNNVFKDRYNSNNDLFMHIRLGDVKHETQCMYDYYDKILSTTDFDVGYISSDSIEDPLCQELIHKYNLTIIDKCEVETIMFASTCNVIVLSGGTFSWMIGFFAFSSKQIYYPDIQTPWYGDIFSGFNWTIVSFLQSN